jgi:hypothetical protein
MQKQKGGIELIVLAIVVLGSFIITGAYLPFGQTPSSYNPVTLKDIGSQQSKDSLQLKGLSGSPLPTPTLVPQITPPPVSYTPPPVQPPNPNPTTPPSSPPASAPPPSPWSCTTPFEVRNCSCMTVYTDGHRIMCPNGLPSNPKIQYCIDILNLQDPNCILTPALKQQGCTSECYAKPVIYLYPLIPTTVSVKIETAGSITESIPFYPKNGWQDVLALPNGTLMYQGKVYNELYYETDVKKADEPKTGMVVNTKNIQSALYTITANLGLIKPEQDELVNYWLPKLNNLNKKYILISLVDKMTKEKNDKVIISPKPDTRIEFILYFKGLDSNIKIEPLLLPKNPPQRVGFTAVEWGGTIAKE